MYWVYFILFIAGVISPLFIEGDFGDLSENAQEALFILMVGTLAFLLYVIKEKSLIRHMREKLSLQKQKTTITRDLSQTYSYIGEVNRKIDIVALLLKRLVETTEKGTVTREHLVWEVLDAAKVILPSDHVALRVIPPSGALLKIEDRETRKIFSKIRSQELRMYEKTLFHSEDIQGIFSAPFRGELRLCLLFQKKHNNALDEDMVSILLSLLILLEIFFQREQEVI
jgi:hypothetical protein